MSLTDFSSIELSDVGTLRVGPVVAAKVALLLAKLLVLMLECYINFCICCSRKYFKN